MNSFHSLFLTRNGILLWLPSSPYRLRVHRPVGVVRER